MGTTIQAVNAAATSSAQLFQKTAIIPQDLRVDMPKDVLELGKSSKPDSKQSMQIVYDRAMEKLRSVVSDAKTALGMSADQQIDTSPDATANRIADFAIGAYDKWAKNHTDLSAEDSRKQFADFIGGAIQQGISEAKGILTSLNALSTDVSKNIDATWQKIQTRLSDFVGNNK